MFNKIGQLCEICKQNTSVGADFKPKKVMSNTLSFYVITVMCFLNVEMATNSNIFLCCKLGKSLVAFSMPADQQCAGPGRRARLIFVDQIL